MIPYIITAIEDESDREFMTALFFQYQKLLYSTIQKYTRDQWLVDDIFQTTLEKLIGKLSFLRTLDRDRLVNYLIATARNTAYNEFRYRTRHTAENYDDFDEMYPAEDSRSNVESALIHKEDMARLSEIWPKLDARAQYLLEAKYILGKKIARNRR